MTDQHLDPETERHMETWRGFGKLMLWSVIGMAVLLLLMRWLVVTPTAVG